MDFQSVCEVIDPTVTALINSFNSAVLISYLGHFGNIIVHLVFEAF